MTFVAFTHMDAKLVRIITQISTNVNFFMRILLVALYLEKYHLPNIIV